MRTNLIKVVIVIVVAWACVSMVLILAGCDSRTAQVELEGGRVIYYSSTTFLRDNQLGSVRFNPETMLFEVTGWNAETSPMFGRMLNAIYEAGVKAGKGY